MYTKLQLQCHFVSAPVHFRACVLVPRQYFWPGIRLLASGGEARTMDHRHILHRHRPNAAPWLAGASKKIIIIN